MFYVLCAKFQCFVIVSAGNVRVVDIEKMEKLQKKHILWLNNDENLTKAEDFDDTSPCHYMINFFGPNFVIKWLNRSPLWKVSYLQLCIVR